MSTTCRTSAGNEESRASVDCSGGGGGETPNGSPSGFPPMAEAAATFPAKGGRLWCAAALEAGAGAPVGAGACACDASVSCNRSEPPATPPPPPLTPPLAPPPPSVPSSSSSRVSADEEATGPLEDDGATGTTAWLEGPARPKKSSAPGGPHVATALDDDAAPPRPSAVASGPSDLVWLSSATPPPPNRRSLTPSPAEVRALTAVPALTP